MEDGSAKKKKKIAEVKTTVSENNERKPMVFLISILTRNCDTK